MSKHIIVYILFIAIGLIGYIAAGLYFMEIEDHYGDLQDVYFKSKDDDLIINLETKQFGYITKGWTRSNAITQQNDTLDLYTLIYTNGDEKKYLLLRSDLEINIKDLTFEKIIDQVNKGSIETIFKN